MFRFIGYIFSVVREAWVNRQRNEGFVTPDEKPVEVEQDAPSKEHYCFSFSRIKPRESDFRHLCNFIARGQGHGCIMVIKSNDVGEQDRIDGLIAFPVLNGFRMTSGIGMAMRRELPNFLITSSSKGLDGCFREIVNGDTFESVRRTLFD